MTNDLKHFCVEHLLCVWMYVYVLCSCKCVIHIWVECIFKIKFCLFLINLFKSMRLFCGSLNQWLTLAYTWTLTETNFDRYILYNCDTLHPLAVSNLKKKNRRSSINRSAYEQKVRSFVRYYLECDGLNDVKRDAHSHIHIYVGERSILISLHVRYSFWACANHKQILRVNVIRMCDQRDLLIAWVGWTGFVSCSLKDHRTLLRARVCGVEIIKKISFIWCVNERNCFTESNVKFSVYVKWNRSTFQMKKINFSLWCYEHAFYARNHSAKCLIHKRYLKVLHDIFLIAI